jgi:hypothetical protein
MPEILRGRPPKPGDAISDVEEGSFDDQETPRIVVLRKDEPAIWRNRDALNSPRYLR